MKMHPGLTDLLLMEIDLVEGCEVTKRRIVDVLQSFAQMRVVLSNRSIAKRRGIALACEMIERRHLSHSDASIILQQRLGVSRRTAYRLLKAAVLQMRRGS